MTKVLQATLNMVDLEIRDIIDKEHGRALGLPHPCAWRTAAPFEDCPLRTEASGRSGDASRPSEQLVSLCSTRLDERVQLVEILTLPTLTSSHPCLERCVVRSASPRQHDLASPAQAYSRTQSSLGTHLLILSTPRSRGARWEVMVFWSCLGAIHVACARAKHRRMRRRFAHHDGSQRRPGGRERANDASLVLRRATSRDPIPPYGVGWGPIRGGQFNNSFGYESDSRSSAAPARSRAHIGAAGSVMK